MFPITHQLVLGVVSPHTINNRLTEPCGSVLLFDPQAHMWAAPSFLPSFAYHNLQCGWQLWALGQRPNRDQQVYRCPQMQQGMPSTGSKQGNCCCTSFCSQSINMHTIFITRLSKFFWTHIPIPSLTHLLITQSCMFSLSCLHSRSWYHPDLHIFSYTAFNYTFVHVLISSSMVSLKFNYSARCKIWII